MSKILYLNVILRNIDSFVTFGFDIFHERFCFIWSYRDE